MLLTFESETRKSPIYSREFSRSTSSFDSEIFRTHHTSIHCVLSRPSSQFTRLFSEFAQQTRGSHGVPPPTKCKIQFAAVNYAERNSQPSKTKNSQRTRLEPPRRKRLYPLYVSPGFLQRYGW